MGKAKGLKLWQLADLREKNWEERKKREKKTRKIVILQTKHQENKSNPFIPNCFESLNVKIAAWYVNGPFHFMNYTFIHSVLEWN